MSISFEGTNGEMYKKILDRLIEEGMPLQELHAYLFGNDQETNADRWATMQTYLTIVAALVPSFEQAMRDLTRHARVALVGMALERQVLTPAKNPEEVATH